MPKSTLSLTWLTDAGDEDMDWLFEWELMSPAAEVRWSLGLRSSCGEDEDDELRFSFCFLATGDKVCGGSSDSSFRQPIGTKGSKAEDWPTKTGTDEDGEDDEDSEEEDAAAGLWLDVAEALIPLDICDDGI